MAENDGRRFGSTQKHKAVCSACKKDCEVPFPPAPGRDVFCLECWKKRRK